MPTPQGHFKDELQDWLDGRLDAATCDLVEQHVETCAECRREYEAMAWTKQSVTKHFPAAEAPAALRASILQAIHNDAVPTDAETAQPSFWRRRGRPILAAAAVLVVTALLVFVWFSRRADLPTEVAQDFKAYQAQQLALELNTADVKEMESYFATHGVGFDTRVFDLGMMQYQLVGGRVQKPGRAPRAMFVYQGAANQKLVCQMFVGRVSDLPKGATLRENKGLQFHTYQRDGLTAVFWPEGAILCVLVSDLEPEQVVQLAFAKAMP